MRVRANPRRPSVRALLLVLVLLGGLFAMHGLTAHHSTSLVAAHGTSDAAAGTMSMTALTPPSSDAVSADRGPGGGHQPQLGAETCLAVLAAAITLLLLFGACGWRPGGVLVALRAASRHRLIPRPPRALTPSLAQLCVLRT